MTKIKKQTKSRKIMRRMMKKEMRMIGKKKRRKGS